VRNPLGGVGHYLWDPMAMLLSSGRLAAPPPRLSTARLVFFVFLLLFLLSVLTHCIASLPSGNASRDAWKATRCSSFLTVSRSIWQHWATVRPSMKLLLHRRIRGCSVAVSGDPYPPFPAPAPALQATRSSPSNWAFCQKVTQWVALLKAEGVKEGHCDSVCRSRSVEVQGGVGHYLWDDMAMVLSSGTLESPPPLLSAARLAFFFFLLLLRVSVLTHSIASPPCRTASLAAWNAAPCSLFFRTSRWIWRH
jgi:uncharacterized membrane protein YtjA (UPF0391 family)